MLETSGSAKKEKPPTTVCEPAAFGPKPLDRPTKKVLATMNLKIVGVLGTEEKYPKQWKGVKNTNEYVLFYGPPNPPEMVPCKTMVVVVGKGKKD